MRTRIFSVMAKYPGVTLLIWLTCCVVMTSGVSWLKFDFSPESVYSGQDDIVEFSNRHKRLFRFEDSVCLVVLESTDSRSVLRPECVAWVRRLGDAARLIPGVVDVTSITTLQKPQISVDGLLGGESAGQDSGDPITWVPLITPSDLASDETLRERLDRLPLLNDLLVSRDGSLLLTVVTLDPARRGISAITPPVLALQELLETLTPPRLTRTHLSGVPLIRVDVIRSLETDQVVMVPICGTVFVCISLILFRSWRLTGISLLAVGLSVSNTVGLMGWTGQPFNLLSNVVPPLSLIIAAANCVHIVSRFRNELLTREEAGCVVVVDVMREMSVTCFLTLLTTAIGFGSLLLARSDLLQTLAVQAMLAMGCSYLSLMIVLTCGLTLFAEALRSSSTHTGSSAWAGPREWPGSWTRTHLAQPLKRRRLRAAAVRSGALLLSQVTRRAGWVAVLHIGLAVAALFWVRDLRVNSLLFETYDAANPIMQTIALLDDKLSGMVSMEIQLQAASPDDFYRPDVLASVANIRRRAEADPRITFYRDYAQVLAAFDSRVLSSRTATAAAAARRIHRVTQRVDVSQVTRDFLARDEPAARVMLRVHDIGSAGLLELMNDVSLWASESLPQGIQFRITGDAALHAICMGVFIRDLFVSLLAASGIIFILIAVLFQSVRIGLISTLPNLFPLVITLAWMKFRQYDLNAGNVIVFAISLGIAVDDTIHFLARYRQEVRTGCSSGRAVQNTISSCGQAIVSTSVLIVLGLAALVFSDFVPTRRFAELTAVTMLAALPGDLLLLPALLIMFGKSRAK